MSSGGSDARGSTSRQSYDAIAGGFGEGFNAPLLVVANADGGATSTKRTSVRSQRG